MTILSQADVPGITTILHVVARPTVQARNASTHRDVALDGTE